jgi:hypothetical protein
MSSEIKRPGRFRGLINWIHHLDKMIIFPQDFIFIKNFPDNIINAFVVIIVFNPFKFLPVCGNIGCKKFFLNGIGLVKLILIIGQ